MLRTNETETIKWHETCKCKCRLDAIVCNNKQCWNKNRCECKELINKGVCDKKFIWNRNNCECEYNKSCDFSECLDYKNCKCRKRLVNKLVEECNETIDEVKLTKITLAENENSYKCNSCILYIVLFSIFFTINAGFGAYLRTINTQIVMKNMFLDIMITFIKQKIINIKLEKSNNIKN